MSKGLMTRWTDHLEEQEDKKRFSELVRNSTQVLSRLKTILEQGEKNEERNLYSEAALSNPNWANAMAFAMGKKAHNRRILALLSFLD